MLEHTITPVRASHTVLLEISCYPSTPQLVGSRRRIPAVDRPPAGTVPLACSAGTSWLSVCLSDSLKISAFRQCPGTPALLCQQELLGCWMPEASWNMSPIDTIRRHLSIAGSQNTNKTMLILTSCMILLLSSVAFGEGQLHCTACGRFL